MRSPAENEETIGKTKNRIMMTQKWGCSAQPRFCAGGLEAAVAVAKAAEKD